MVMEKLAIEKEALALAPKERADLVDALLASLNLEATAAIRDAWAKEEEDRLNAHSTGEIDSRSGPAVISEQKARYKG